MDEIRKFSAIYGRFDCKRKPEKPLTLHEVSLHLSSQHILQMLKVKVKVKVKVKDAQHDAYAGLCERGCRPDLPSGSGNVDSQGRAFPTGKTGITAILCINSLESINILQT